MFIWLTELNFQCLLVPVSGGTIRGSLHWDINLGKKCLFYQGQCQVARYVESLSAEANDHVAVVL